MREPDRSGFVELNRTRLRIWDWGELDAPAVICAHGAFDHGRMWDGIAPGLAELGLRVIAPDLRGHGDSGRLSSGHVWAASALDLGVLARHVGAPVGLVGHSFGGGQSLYAAGVWPELARWVVNLDGLGPSSEGFENERGYAEGASKAFASAERLMEGKIRIYASLEEMVERRAAVNTRLPREWVEHLVLHGAMAVEGGYAWKADPTFSVGLPGDFTIEHLHAEQALVTCPVLVLTGSEHDTWSDLTDEEIAFRVSLMRDARHESIEGAGHYVHIEQPEEVLAAIATFLKEVVE